MSIAVRSSVPVKWPKEVEHVWFKGTNEEPSASFSWEPAVLTSSSLPAASSAELPTKDSEPKTWFRRFPGTAKWGGAQTRLGPKSNMQPEQSKSVPKRPLLLTSLNSVCWDRDAQEHWIHIAKMKDLQCVLRVKKPDSAAESPYELWITLYLMMLNCICHLAAKPLCFYLSGVSHCSPEHSLIERILLHWQTFPNLLSIASSKWLINTEEKSPLSIFNSKPPLIRSELHPSTKLLDLSLCSPVM